MAGVVGDTTGVSFELPERLAVEDRMDGAADEVRERLGLAVDPVRYELASLEISSFLCTTMVGHCTKLFAE